MTALAKRTKRDEFTCCCCGMATESTCCEKCEAAGCGETDYRYESPCVADMQARGWKLLGVFVERVQRKGGFVLARIEGWRRPDGEVAYGRVVEVLS